MAEALIGGAALGAVFGELLKLIINTTIQVLEFEPLLEGFKETLKTIEPEFTGITELNKLSKRPVESRTTLRGYLDDGKKLVVKCSGIKKGEVLKIKKYTKKLIDLNHNICKFFQIEVSLAMMAALKALLGQDKSFDPCRAAGLLDFTVGLDQHLVNLKRKLLEDETRVLVVAAPGGFGKTTLAKKLCHDDEIKGVFGNEIIYVTVSKEASLKSIGQSLHKHYGINNYEFRSEEDAKNQIENLITQKGSDKVLLVLDDVWSESFIQDLKFQIPGYQILVTCRDLFSGSRYDLDILNAKDAKTLFRYHAFTSDETDVSEATVNKIVEFCKGIPLALSVVGASLHNQPEVKWETTLLKWSEGQSIFESHQRLLTCLQTSVDALDELHRDCFLDLGLFPEDDQIAGSALMDMWIEFHGLDDKGLFASEYLRDLELKNLFTLIPIRKAAGEPGGHCSHYRVTQHDVLRELAIHLGRQEPRKEPMQKPRQEPEADRKRLFTEIRSNDFPTWWAERPIAARILSISTDEEFSSTWNDDLNAPKVEVLILNIRSENYTLPEFIKKMSQLKVLIVTGYGVYPTQLDNLEVLGSLSKLHRIRFEHVSVSPFIQAIFTLKTLKKITVVMCKIGDSLSSGTTEYPYTLENLKYLEIDLCYDLKELPAGLCSSVRLEKLVITNCQELDSLPNDLGNLSNLEILNLHCCTKLKALPESIRSLRKLRVLDVSDCSDITTLPEQIGELSSLKAIDISGCEGLKMLPESLAGLEKLKNVTCDEERSYLWKNIESHPGKVEINFVQEDRSETFKIIYH